MKNKKMSNAKKIALIVALIIIIAVIVVIVIRLTKTKDDDGKSEGGGGGTGDQYKELTLTYYDILTCIPGTNSSSQPGPGGNIVDGDLVTLKVPSVLPEGINMTATQDTNGDPVISVTYAKGEYTFLDETLTIENKKNILSEVLFPILDENQMSNPGISRLYSIGVVDDENVSPDTSFQVYAFDTDSTNINTWERSNPIDPTKRTPFVPTFVFAGFIVNGDGSANTYDQNNVCELGQAIREKDGKNYITPNSTFPPLPLV
jgi:hypothetical protein